MADLSSQMCFNGNPTEMTRESIPEAPWLVREIFADANHGM